MTARPPDPGCRRRPLSAAVALVLLLAVVMAAGCVSQTQSEASPNEAGTNNSEPLLEFPGSTTIIAQGAASVSDLRAAGIRDPEQQSFTEYLNYFDLVTFNHTAINTRIKSGQRIPIRIRGKEHSINVTDLASGKGIADRVTGDLDGDNTSRIFLTIGQDQIEGAVVLENETITIARYSTLISDISYPSPSYYVYSSRDVYFDPRKGWVCGGGFEVLELLDKKSPEGDVIHLTEGDFTAVPQLREILRGSRNGSCLPRDEKEFFDRKGNKITCTGGGWYDCQGWNILDYYSYYPGSMESDERRYLEYEGKFYFLIGTTIS